MARATTTVFSGDHDVAAMVFGRDANPDALLETFAKIVEGGGFKVSGFVQRGHCGSADGLRLHDLRTGEVHFAPSPDPGWIVESDLVRSVRDSTATSDLVILNRYGAVEQDGRGLMPLINECAAADTPLLIAVAEHRFDSWIHEVGGMCVKLRCQGDDLERWWSSVRGAPRPSNADAPSFCEMAK